MGIYRRDGASDEEVYKRNPGWQGVKGRGMSPEEHLEATRSERLAKKLKEKEITERKALSKISNILPYWKFCIRCGDLKFRFGTPKFWATWSICENCIGIQWPKNSDIYCIYCRKLFSRITQGKGRAISCHECRGVEECLGTPIPQATLD